jgi:lipopolysaccharide export system permease protein
MSLELIYIVIDLFDNLSDFQGAQVPFWEVLKFYGLLLPSSIIFIVPISLLLGVLYSLAQLTRHNELTAMRASGISLYRLMYPFLFVGIVASITVGIVNETLAPNSKYRTDQIVELHRKHGNEEVFIEKNLPYMNVKEKRVWMVERFDTRTYEMHGVKLAQRRPDNSDAIKIEAGRAMWKDGHWWFYDVVLQNYKANGHPDGPPEVYEFREMPNFNEQPGLFLDEIKGHDYFSVAEIGRFIKTHNLEPSFITRLNVDKQYRLAAPWTCLIVTMIGIPFGSHTGRKGALAGISLILLLFFAYYALIYACLGLGKSGYIHPLLAGWTPHIIFFLTAILMTAKMR